MNPLLAVFLRPDINIFGVKVMAGGSNSAALVYGKLSMSTNNVTLHYLNLRPSSNWSCMNEAMGHT